MENVNVRMPSHIKEELAKQAKMEDRSLSKYLYRIIFAEYEKLNNKGRNK